ncbi:hypothetical protein BpHYR1_007493 [Brachionus plicatilis]|uniref:Uncharacterized protein n=1 Tax=Brachionus plicatilis TaxID=10195 RepID=A0A3M7REU6_BRAPC|nr:hypothetical protein BpHYR1_007493 [Brachionus plicatilis]
MPEYTFKNLFGLNSFSSLNCSTSSLYFWFINSLMLSANSLNLLPVSSLCDSEIASSIWIENQYLGVMNRLNLVIYFHKMELKINNHYRNIFLCVEGVSKICKYSILLTRCSKLRTVFEKN